MITVPYTLKSMNTIGTELPYLTQLPIYYLTHFLLVIYPFYKFKYYEILQFQQFIYIKNGSKNIEGRIFN